MIECYASGEMSLEADNSADGTSCEREAHKKGFEVMKG
jgi:hypothetical protein